MILKVYDGKSFVLFEGNIIRKLTKIPNEYPINYITKKSACDNRDIFYIQNFGEHVSTVVTNQYYILLNEKGMEISKGSME